MTTPLRVLILASEADPYAKVGGLGDVSGSLPKAFKNLNRDIEIRLVIPFHKGIQADRYHVEPVIEFKIKRIDEEITGRVFSAEWDGLTTYLIYGDPLSRSKNVYDNDPWLDGEKYVFFSVAALDSLRLNQSDQFWNGVKGMLTIHNLCYMGAGSETSLSAYGLPPVDDQSLPWWGRQTPMPVGLWSADKIVAVSPSYAQEIQTSEFGCGLESFLFSRCENILGITNGIDTASWDPSTDQVLAGGFSSNKRELRAVNKQYLQGKCGFELDDTVPLLAMVTRIDHQKDVGLALDALRLIQDQNWQMVLLGTGQPELENAVRQFQNEFPLRMAAFLRFDANLSRQIYAGADIFLMPSKYEPYGLGQMIAMRYGAVPLARATGGLRDTIDNEETGFLFSEFSPSVMADTLRKAIMAFRNEDAWSRYQLAGMMKDFSWNKSAQKYADLYFSLSREMV